MFVFDGPAPADRPKSLDENIVQGTAFRIHADSDLIAYQRFDKVIAGELTAAPAARPDLC